MAKGKFIYFILFVFLLFLDQFSKNQILHRLDFGSTEPFIPGFIQINLTSNTGGAFSILKGYPGLFKIVGIINVFIFVYIVFLRKLNINTITRAGFTFILSGSLGNLIDRFIRGSVTDFLSFQFIDFPVFNLADVFIDVGVGLVLIGWFLKQK